MLRRAVTLVLALLVLSGCAVGERSPENDLDGDFLPDDNEVEGWNITVALSVRSCGSTGPRLPGVAAHVSSDKYEDDTDRDGLGDFEEYQWGGDPHEPDTDKDGLSDRAEYDLIQSRRFYAPADLSLGRADSDDDCLSDKVEVEGFDITGLGKRSTDPTDADTDHDGLSDPVEARERRSDPTDADTDDDGAGDFLDLDPLNDLAVKLELVSVELRNVTGTVPVRFTWQYTGPQGPSTRDSPVFNATAGQRHDLSPALSPGILDTTDATGVGTIPLDFWAVRADTGAFMQLGGVDGVLPLRIDPARATWKAGDLTGRADNSLSVVEGAQGRLEFRLDVVYV